MTGSASRIKIFRVVIATAAGAAAAVTLFSILQPCRGSLSCLLPALAVVWAVMSALFHLALTRLVAPDLGARTRRMRLVWLATWLLASAITIFVFPMQPERIHFLFPSHTLTVQPTGERNLASTGDWVRIVYFQDGERFDFPLRTFAHSEAWEEDDQILQTGEAASGAAVFHGSLLNRGRLGLLTGPDGGVARVTWDGQAQNVDLYTPEPALKLIKLDGSGVTAKPFVLLAYACYLAGFFAFYLVLATILVRGGAPAPANRKVGRFAFAAFAAPMLAAWTFYLVVFFPGVMTSDSTHQWRMLSGIDTLVDWHPPIYTFLEWLFSRIWFSPAPTAIVQILALSLVAGWGISALYRAGLPRPAAWVLSGLLALSPVNGVMVITLWKDIPYAISVLALFILFFQLVISQGQWMARRGAWVILGLVSAAAGLFRHNGLVVAVVMLALALALFWRYRWRLLLAAGLFAATYGLVSGPLYTLAGVQRVSGVLRDTIYLHHIAAHVAARTPLTDSERNYLDQLRPLGSWEYSYCRVDPTFFTPEFNREVFAANSPRNFEIFFDLLLRDPKVDLTHTLGSSSMVWRVQRQCYFLDHAVYMTGGKITWVEPNEMGIAEASLLPGLVVPMAEMLHFTNSEVAAPWLWGPALYLHVALFCLVVYAYRTRDWKKLLLALIPLVQSLVMVAVNIAADFRYQYSVYLVCFFSVACLFLPGASGAPPTSVKEDAHDR